MGNHAEWIGSQYPKYSYRPRSSIGVHELALHRIYYKYAIYIIHVPLKSLLKLL